MALAEDAHLGAQAEDVGADIFGRAARPEVVGPVGQRAGERVLGFEPEAEPGVVLLAFPDGDDDDLVAGPGLDLVDADLREDAQVLETSLRLLDQREIGLVAFADAELLADDLVPGRPVPGDEDVPDGDRGPLGDLVDERDAVFRRTLDAGDDLGTADAAVEIERFDLTDVPLDVGRKVGSVLPADESGGEGLGGVEGGPFEPDGFDGSSRAFPDIEDGPDAGLLLDQVQPDLDVGEAVFLIEGLDLPGDGEKPVVAEERENGTPSRTASRVFTSRLENAAMPLKSTPTILYFSPGVTSWMMRISSGPSRSGSGRWRTDSPAGGGG